MKENTQDKALIRVNENSKFYKIKIFFRSLFYKIDTNLNESINVSKTTTINPKTSFIEEIKNIENEEINLLKLQKQYRNREIKEEDLTEEQLNSLCILYDNQIKKLRNSNEIRKQKLLEYRRTLQTNN